VKIRIRRIEIRLLAVATSVGRPVTLSPSCSPVAMMNDTTGW
jgi:hypothetical protein